MKELRKSLYLLRYVQKLINRRGVIYIFSRNTISKENDRIIQEIF